MSGTPQILRAKLNKGRPAIVVTHRLTTAMHADVIHVIEQGRIVESGNHDELLRTRGSVCRVMEQADERHGERWSIQGMMTGMRLENQLLLCVARRSVDTATVERIRSLVEQELNWEYSLDSADRHGLMPLLYRHLSYGCPEVMPEDVRIKLKHEFLNNSRWTLYLTSELLRIVKFLEDNGISAVGFKGPLLSLAAYGDIALRQFWDLDILVDKRDFRRTKALLESEGYAIDLRLTAAQQSSHLRFDCEVPFRHAESGCVVDLHWGLAPKRFPSSLTQEDIFKRLQTIKVGKHALRTFSNEDLLLFLCVHGAKHLWSRLEWICAVAELVRNSEGIDWTTVVELAKKSHGLRRLLLGLMLARDLQPELDIPGPVFAAVPDCESLQRCAERLRERIFEIKSEKENQTGIFLFHLIAMDRKLDAFIGLLRSMLLPTVSDWRFVTLPDALYPLYYVLRPLRLAAEYSAALGKWIRSRTRFLMKSPT